MTAYEIAKDMYKSKGLDLDEEILLYAKHEYLHISPENFIMARLCPDYWFVQVAVGKGSLRFFLELMPASQYRPMVAWARGLRSETIKFYDTERLRKLLCSKHQPLNGSKSQPDIISEALRCLNHQGHHYRLQTQVELRNG